MKTRKSLLLLAKESPGSDSWYVLFEIYQPLIEKWLRNQGIKESDVADIAQDVLLTVSQELPKFEHNNRMGAFRAWLKTITVFRCRRHWEKHKRKVPVVSGTPVTDTLEQVSDPESELSRVWDAEHDEHVLNCVLRIVQPEFDPKVFAVFQRATFEDIPAKEIAAEFDISVGQVYKYKFRVLKRLTEEANGLVEIK